MLKDSSI